jgi:uncharacterized protein YjbJ (UPF0337 family)
MLAASSAVAALEARCITVAETDSRRPDRRTQMGLLDRLLGRTKKAAGDLTGDAELRQEGASQEREGAAKEAAERHEDLAQTERERAAEEHAEREGGTPSS